jgi:hypothetical protein
LETQGIRPTSRGGHVALRDAVAAQFGALSGGQPLRSFDRLRWRRNDIEYLGGSRAIDAQEVDEALARAVAIVEYAECLAPKLPAF